MTNATWDVLASAVNGLLNTNSPTSSVTYGRHAMRLR